MSMDRWNPFRDMDTMRQAMDRWMDDRIPGFFNQQGNNILSVAVDLHETERGYELEASLPGVKAEDLDISIDRDTLTIRGQSQTSQERTGKNFLYRERRAGSFYRTLRLPEPVDSDKVEATLEHGVLRMQLPRLSQTSNRRVQVRSSQTGSSQVMGSGMSQMPAMSSQSGSGMQSGGMGQSGGSSFGSQSSNAMSNQQQPGQGGSQQSSGVRDSSGTPGYTDNSSRSGQSGEPQPGTAAPGASRGEHSQVDHRGQTGGQTYTSGGYTQSPQGPGTSQTTGRGTADNYGAGQGGDTTSQSQTMGNNS